MGGLAAVAIGTYLWGVARVRRAGRPWPIQRTLTWSAGWLLMLYLAVSGLWEYSTALYSWHMFVHMTVNMLVPALCVPGRADHPGARGVQDRDDPAGRPRRHRTRFRASPLIACLQPAGAVAQLRRLAVPDLLHAALPVADALPLGAPAVLLYFMVTGYLFFAMIVGVDKRLTDLPHLVRLAMVISIMPFRPVRGRHHELAFADRRRLLPLDRHQLDPRPDGRPEHRGPSDLDPRRDSVVRGHDRAGRPVVHPRPRRERRQRRRPGHRRGRLLRLLQRHAGRARRGAIVSPDAGCWWPFPSFQPRRTPIATTA